MRGKGYLEPFYSIYHRITPAYAGKSSLSLSAGLLGADHPRLCGEKVIPPPELPPVPGSPPPMRGKALTIIVLFIFFRITPAYAGKSLTEKQKDVFGKDHPRLCGEKVDFV